jgi:hypothetical protein
VRRSREQNKDNAGENHHRRTQSHRAPCGATQEVPFIDDSRTERCLLDQQHKRTENDEQNERHQECQCDGHGGGGQHFE